MATEDYDSVCEFIEEYRPHTHTHTCTHARTCPHTHLYIITIESPVDTLDNPWLKGMAPSSSTHTPHLHKDTNRRHTISLYTMYSIGT